MCMGLGIPSRYSHRLLALFRHRARPNSDEGAFGFQDGSGPLSQYFRSILIRTILKVNPMKVVSGDDGTRAKACLSPGPW